MKKRSWLRRFLLLLFAVAGITLPGTTIPVIASAHADYFELRDLYYSVRESAGLSV